MSLASRLTALAQAVGADIKALNTKINTSTPIVGAAPAGASTAIPQNASVWALLPVGSPMTTSTGTTDEFERQSEGSVLVKQAGWYAVTFSTNAGTQASETGIQHRIALGPANTTPVVGGMIALQDASSPVPSGSLTYIGPIAANTRIALLAANRDTVSRNSLCLHFGIAKINGAKGDKGDPGYSPMSAIGGGTSVNAAALGWIQLPCDSAPFLTVTTTDGTADFTRTAAGGLTFNKAGTYDVACTMGNKGAAQTVAGAMDLRLVLGAVGNATPDQNEKQVAIERRPAVVGDYNIASMGSTITVSAGQTLAAWAYTPGATTAMGITAISISRSGGPQGAKGADGSTAAFNVVDLVASNAYTISGLDGDLDYGYEFILMGSIPAGSGTRNVTIVPNALVVPANAALKSYRTGYYRETNAMTADNLVADGIGFVLCPAYTTSGIATLNAQATLVAHTGSERVCKASFEASDASTIYRVLHGVSASKWTDTGTKITSLRILSDGAFTGKLLWRKIVM